MVQEAFKLQTTVDDQGQVRLPVPLPPGTPVEVVVLAPADDTFDDLVRAASSSTDFWDNPLDDEDWNCV
ncbi:MAG: hypothetical protein JNM56_34690 [Planctomycetia bacterium]|nr:hypothetical protein [Planctomycetia bacterium]